MLMTPKMNDYILIWKPPKKRSLSSLSSALALDCSAASYLNILKWLISLARQREYGDRWLSCLPMSINHCWHIAANLCYFMLLLVDPGLNHTVLGTKSNLRQFHTLLHWTYTDLQHLPPEFESVLHSQFVPQLWSPCFSPSSWAHDPCPHYTAVTLPAHVFLIRGAWSKPANTNVSFVNSTSALIGHLNAFQRCVVTLVFLFVCFFWLWGNWKILNWNMENTETDKGINIEM